MHAFELQEMLRTTCSYDDLLIGRSALGKKIFKGLDASHFLP